MSLHNGNGQHRGKGSNPASLNAIKPHRFKPGNKQGQGGNQCAAKALELRTALFAAVNKADVKAIGDKLIAEAREGNVAAAHELFDRLFGKSQASIDITTAGRPLYVKALVGVSGEDL